jgi:hypothetical protein
MPNSIAQSTALISDFFVNSLPYQVDQRSILDRMLALLSVASLLAFCHNHLIAHTHNQHKTNHTQMTPTNNQLNKT